MAGARVPKFKHRIIAFRADQACHAFGGYTACRQHRPHSLGLVDPRFKEPDFLVETIGNIPCHAIDHERFPFFQNEQVPTGLAQIYAASCLQAVLAGPDPKSWT